MGYSTRGKQDGTGPHKDSAQRRLTGNKGRRQLGGTTCPRRKPKSRGK